MSDRLSRTPGRGGFGGWPWLLAAAALLVAGFPGNARARAVDGRDGADARETPRQVYTAACASCHGSNGTGMPREHVGFDVPLPDFTDCSFATREPDGDWFAVVHQGGPARAFDHRMPSFGEALREEQIDLAIRHVRTFCKDRGWPSGNLNQPRPMFTEKAFVEDEAVLTVGAAVQAPYEVQARLVFEKRFGKRSQFEVAIPFGAVERPASGTGQGAWQGGLGDVAFGFKHVLAGVRSTGTLLSGLAEIVLPTGREDRGMGSGHLVFEPVLLLGQDLGPAGFLHFQGGFEVPVGTGTTPEGLWRLAYGRTITQGRFGRAWTPMVELLGWADVEQGASAHWDLAPQIQLSLSTRQHISLCLAARIPLEPGNDRTIGVWAYFLWEWFDGGLWEGW
mgnify:CR=1 FL=1